MTERLDQSVIVNNLRDTLVPGELDLDDPDTNSGREIGDEEDETPIAHGPQKLSLKRRAEIAKFNAWFSEHQVELLHKDHSTEQLRHENTDGLSLKAILAQQESQVIITNPRDYQMELFEKAKTQNTIAVLDTGSGKTLIAVLLLRHTLDEELENRAVGNPHRVSFFLVDKVTLVFQQYAVLHANLDQKIDHFCGQMGTSLWSKEIWKDHISKNMVIVCTAEVLVQALFHSFITIEQINLLIFDEAHHAKKGHSYAKIIKDFYLGQADISKRPRIFGMTASPVDAEQNVYEQARELETLLHSRIVTASNMALLQMTVSRPLEEVVRYAAPAALLLHSGSDEYSSSVSELYQHLWSKYHDVDDFARLFRNAKDISFELGCWCSDTYWSFAFAEREAKKQEVIAERRHNKRKKETSIENLNAEISKLHEAHDYVQGYKFEKPKLEWPDLGPKVLALYVYLHQYFERPSDARCLVFVEKRYTARILARAFTQIGGPHLRCEALTGSNSSSSDGLHSSFRQQALTVLRFKEGQLNCLFATSIAEEGIDIQDCNLVIRFDPCKSMIQYVQSRGRARHKNSKFVHFIEKGNGSQQQRLDEIRASEKEMRKFCETLPEDRLLKGNDHDHLLENAFRREKEHRCYIERSSGAKLTYDFSLVVLAHFVSCLPHDDEEAAQLHYVMSVRGGEFVCEVLLPSKSPIRSMIGRPATRKATAKRSAAFEACIQLRKGKYLDEHFMPIYAKQLPAMRNALLAIHDKSFVVYEMQLKPSFWSYSRGSRPIELYLTVISLSAQWDRPVSPLGLLTRLPLPQFPSFPIYRITGQSVQVQTATFQIGIAVSPSAITLLTQFTFTVLKDIFNKTFEYSEMSMSYWLAPITFLTEKLGLDCSHPSDLIDSKMLEEAETRRKHQWTAEMPHDLLANRFMVDIWDGGRRFFTKAVVLNMTAGDAVPVNTAPGPSRDSIIDYTVSLYKKARAKRIWDPHQPVIEAVRTLHRLNVLADPTDQDRNAVTKCYVCPEPLIISILDAQFASMCLLFPAIIHRLESYMIALEACQSLNITVEPGLALEAMTKDCDNSDDSQGERINFQRGMGANYERLEFIGDCFLKMSTTIALFAQRASSDEYALHVDRMVMICNKNLYNVACENKFYKYIRGLSFSRRTWYPEGLKLIEGKGAKKSVNEVQTQRLAKKTIADVCEAVIGAAFVAHSDASSWQPGHFDDAVRAVTAFVKNPAHSMDCWKDFYGAYSKPAYQTKPSTASQKDLAEKLQIEHSYTFQYPRLLRSAFNHPSQPTMFDGIPNYQRLEFLGDSLLDMTAVSFLFQRYPDKDPQWLTEHKMAMVSNQFLGALCVKLGFHRHLRHNSSPIQNHVQNFVRELEDAEREAKGARDYWLLVKLPPKCLPDIVESYVGAVFVDSEFNYAEVQRFFDEHIQWYFEDMSVYDTFANNHPTTKLHALLSTYMGCYNYRLMAQDVKFDDGSSPKILAGLMIHGEVITHGQAASSKNAKVYACRKALELISGLPPHEFRQKYKCDCRPSDQENMSQGIDTDKVGTAV